MQYSSYVVTGGNKGIGLAIVKQILKKIDNSFVFLGSRSVERGNQAINEIKKIKADYKNRVQLLQIDTSKRESIEKAVDEVKKYFAANSDKGPLEGLINNAGVLGNLPLKQVLDVNVRGVRNVTNSFIPIMKKTGRVVSIGSGSAPMFVQGCNQKYVKFFTDKTITWESLEAVMLNVTKEFDNEKGGCKAMKEMGLSKDNGDEMAAYGFSKALLHSLTMLLARENPSIKINVCSPGFIMTDMTLKMAGGDTEKAKSMGMKTAEEGTFSTLRLLTSNELKGNGFYYGSDGLRSPLHKYRSPGDPEYTE